MNKIILKGRLTRDPEEKATANTTVTKFGIAVNRKMDRDKADFFNCVCFGKTAEFMAKYGQKGKEFLVSGRMENDEYTDREGNKKSYPQVVVEEVEFTSPVKTLDGSVAKADEEFAKVEDEGLPFA